MIVLIDDIRKIDNVDIVARTAKEGKKILQKYKGKIDLLYLDHDLGCKESGYDITVWALKNNLMPKRVKLITNNPVGRENILKLLESYGYSNYSNKYDVKNSYLVLEEH